MIAKIQKWGNSLGIRIPKVLAQDAKVQEGAIVELSVEEGRLVIVPVTTITYDLDDLLREITPKNCHREIDLGAAIGGEVW